MSTAKVSSPSPHLPIKKVLASAPKEMLFCWRNTQLGEHHVLRAPGQEALRASWKWMCRAQCACQLTSAPPSALGKAKKAGMQLGCKSGNKASKEQSKKLISFWECSFILLSC